MGWTLLVDRGGTFTDVVARGPAGQQVVRKLLSVTEDGDATAQVAEGLVVDELRLGTTVATNALLERSGERVLLITTRGFADLLEIGSQERPDIFALEIRKRVPLHAAVVEIDERILADGSVRRAPDEAAVRAALDGCTSVAVLFLNAYVNPVHELLVGRIARELGVVHVSLSHQVSPEIGVVGRGDTTVADAYLTPGLRRSVQRVDVGGGQLLCMQSSGGLIDREHFSGKDAILSGPAGGVIATGHVGRLTGLSRLIGLDMGGTSTDVFRWSGEPELLHESVIAGVRIRAPAFPIETVAAGGGSICSFRDGRFLVGPESAGADPGPACYGRGGPATVTDCNLLLGRMRPEWFPHLPLDEAAARKRLSAFGDPERAARGFLDVAVANMADAIRRISVARGVDPRDHALCAFGGAGGQHACALARSLGMREVIVHPLAGVLSAWGLGQARRTFHAAAAILDPTTDEPAFPVQAARQALADQGVEQIHITLRVDVRYAGVDATVDLPWTTDWKQRFEAQHRERFGFIKPGHALELVTARVVASEDLPTQESSAEEQTLHRPEPEDSNGSWPVFVREKLRPGAQLSGPALVLEPNATTVVEDGWTLRVDAHRMLRLEDHGRPKAPAVAPAASPDPAAAPPSEALGEPPRRDPVLLEIMSNRFMSIAEQMGEHLRRVAHSTNIKERLDFSCALFDVRGRLVANAPHIPVHLGAMGETVRGLIKRQTLRPGDAWLSNDPFHGGSHLPDLTVVTPVYREGQLAFLLANRGHHADVGGSCPGSLPPESTSIHEEGALFNDVLLLRDGELQRRPVVETLDAAGTRGVPERLADLEAQIACNMEGVRLLDQLCDEHGTAWVQAWMKHVEDNAAEVMADVVSTLQDGRFEDQLDDGSRIRVQVSLHAGRARVDFAGTSPQQPGNRNAPRAVTIAAVLYVFRTLARRAIPLNAGCLRPLDIVIPEGSLLDPRHPAAVVGGNVETSQRVVDVLYGALGKLAASQGTMNNLTFGDDSFGYYETVCGGAGAGYGFDGASAVHTHMTNTRITDPEVLEQRYPVVVTRFAVRRGSGGSGVWRGGDGVVRELEFLRPLEVSLLAERRRTAPFGLRAGSGARGEQTLGPRGVRLLTPGGGGYSPSPEQWAAMPARFARQLFREDRWRGPTTGISVDGARAQLIAVPAAQAEQLAARLGDALLHRSLPGDPHFESDASGINLATDLPLYLEHAPGLPPRECPKIAITPELVFFVYEQTHDTPVLPIPHWTNAPKRHLLLEHEPAR